MIAISYRREDSLSVTGRIYDRLQGEFGKGKVFMDFDSIPYGVDFRDHIKQMIDRSKVVVAIIGPDWLGKRRHRSRRIDDPADFVRLEIGYALDRGLPIIPVLVDDTLMPRPTELPKEIEGLAFRNALTLDVGIDFHHHIDRLVAGINQLLIKPTPAPPEVKQPSERAPTDLPLAAKETQPSTSGEARKPVQAREPVPLQPFQPSLGTPLQPESFEKPALQPKEGTPESKPESLPEKSPPPDRATIARTTPPSETRPPLEEHKKESPTGTTQSQEAPRLADVVLRPTTISKVPLKESNTSPHLSAPEKTPPLAKTPPPAEPRSLQEKARPKPLEDPVVNREDGGLSEAIDPAILERFSRFGEFLRRYKTGFVVGTSSIVGIIILAVVLPRWFGQPHQEEVTTSTGAAHQSVSPSPVAPPAPSAALPVADSGTLLVTSEPAGIDFELVDAAGERHRGTTPETINSLRNGAASVTYKRGSQEHKESVSVRAGQPSSITWQAPAPETAPSPPQSPPPAPSVNWEAAVRDFVREFVESNAYPDAEREVSFYAPLAEIFGEGSKDHAAIRHDILGYRTKWPIRKNAVRGDILVRQLAPDEYGASFEQTYHVENPTRRDSKNGSVKVNLRIGILDGFPKITSIKDGPPPPIMSTASQSPTANSAVIPGSPQQLVRISNKQYGFSALVPSEIFPDAGRASDVDVMTFSAPAGRTKLQFLIRENRGAGALEKLYREWSAEHTKAQPHKKVHYKPFRGKWFVVSGTDGSANENGFYLKAVDKGKITVMMLLEYDENASPLKNETLLKMAQAFDGN